MQTAPPPRGGGVEEDNFPKAPAQLSRRVFGPEEQMPSINFVMPHWLYWSGLLIFPLVAMYMSRRPRPEVSSRTVALAYFIWFVGGFLGLHRFYLKSAAGLLYWPLFALILYSSSMERQARLIMSDAEAAVTAIDASSARTERQLKKAEAAVSKATATLASTEDETSPSAQSLTRKIQKETDKRDTYTAKLAALAAERKTGSRQSTRRAQTVLFGHARRITPSSPFWRSLPSISCAFPP